MKCFKNLILFLTWGIVFHPPSVHSQTLTASNLTLLVAELSNTPPITVDGLPSFALFYSAQNPANPPLPGNPNKLSAWLIATNTYLLADLDFDYSALAQAQPQLAGRLRGGGVGGGFAMDDGSSGPAVFTIPTNGLWLQITNVTNGLAYLNLNNATDTVYEILTKTDLNLTNWTIEAEVWPTNASVMPFTLEQSGRTNLFVWARDWTGVTENGNTTPDWWFWEYFGSSAFPNGNGSLALSDTNLDSQGNTLAYDYQNGIDPSLITFNLVVTNNYTHTMNVPVQLNISIGSPSYCFVSLDDTNYAADANWQPFMGTNLNVNLGLTPGWHTLWVGLRGLSANSTPSWQCKRLNLISPPILVITNPVLTTVTQPMIQVYGYCQESLSSLNYDFSNAVGVFTGLPAEIIDRYYDTNAWDFTTNYFECLDIPLANGLNTITIHATDLSGGVTTTNFNFMLDYSRKTNAPIVQVNWPQNGMQISGSNFTCRGWISDPTAAVTTQIVTNGVTNFYSAQIERNGNFWLENLTVISGTNTFKVTVTDVAGNQTITNLSIVQSSLVLTVNPVTPASQLWQPTVFLTGTISATNYAVWVNGVKGTNAGNGTWSANNVPINNGGTACFTATAYSPTEQQPDGSFGN